MHRILFFLCLGMLLIAACTSSNKKSEETKSTTDTTATTPVPAYTQGLDEVITGFTHAYLRRNQTKINTFIHPDLGLYVIYRPGAADTYQKIDHLDFDNPTPEHFPYTTFEHNYTLRFEKLPVFDCGKEKWDKRGFFCDTTTQANQLTSIATFDREFNGVSAREVEEIRQIEKNTYRVILTQNENLIFHVKKYHDKWYVIVLDRAYGWCDA